MHFPHYLPFHHFFTNLCCLKNSLKQILSLCFDTELLLVPQVPVPSPWLFQPLLYMRWKHKIPDQAMTLVKHQVLVCTPYWSCLFAPLTRQGSPQSQPQALCPKHWLPCIQGLCLFSSAHPFQTHISQTQIPKAILLFSHQLNSLPLKPLLATLKDDFFSLSFIIISTEAVNKLGLTVQLRVPPWGPSVCCKTICSHSGFVCLSA